MHNHILGKQNYKKTISVQERAFDKILRASSKHPINQVRGKLKEPTCCWESERMGSKRPTTMHHKNALEDGMMELGVRSMCVLLMRTTAGWRSPPRSPWTATIRRRDLSVPLPHSAPAATSSWALFSSEK